MALAVVRELRDVRPPATAEELEQFETDVLAGVRAGAGLGGAGGRHDPRGRRAPGADAVLVRSAAVGDGAARRRRVLREGAAGFAAWHPAGALSGAEHVLPVPGAAAQGRDPSDDRAGDRVPDRRDEPAARREGRGLADSAVRAGGQNAVRRVGRRAGDLLEARPDRPELHHFQADVPGRAAGQRSVQARAPAEPGRARAGHLVREDVRAVVRPASGTARAGRRDGTSPGGCRWRTSRCGCTGATGRQAGNPSGCPHRGRRRAHRTR